MKLNISKSVGHIIGKDIQFASQHNIFMELFHFLSQLLCMSHSLTWHYFFFHWNIHILYRLLFLTLIFSLHELIHKNFKGILMKEIIMLFFFFAWSVIYIKPFYVYEILRAWLILLQICFFKYEYVYHGLNMSFPSDCAFWIFAF